MSWFLDGKTCHFTPPSDWLQIKTIDMHTGGEPLRVIVDGFPEIEGSSVLEYRRDMRENFDHLRTALMWEPRGHADMYGCLPLPPSDQDADFGVLFMHNEGYSTMCGHAVNAVTKLAVEMGWVQPAEPETTVRIETPCGKITSFARVKRGRVESVRFHSVPSFVVGLDRAVDLPGHGEVKYDLAYGGAFYAYVDAPSLGLELVPQNYHEIIRVGRAIKQAVIVADREIAHPYEPDLSFLYGTIFVGGPVSEGIDSRNVCVFADGEVDRSPTGSGVSGRMAIHRARGELQVGERMSIESLVGSVFHGSVVREETYGPFPSVIAQVEGKAHLTGTHTFLIDPEDPMRTGFMLR